MEAIPPASYQLRINQTIMEKIPEEAIAVYKFVELELDRIERVMVPLRAHIKFVMDNYRKENER